ncbi:beta-glucosidase [Fusarium agapanthi]|uniref:beta-glucosidase n=1 Tax=Fusarium agapanthi TaxID=1803897 RepID=A0A9P5B8N8_9HYPO|nr:beta-glucosidase [Fusarium agapanthi]
MDVEALIQQLTLEEKVQLTAGVGWWHTASIDRLSIPPIRLSDGPNGVRGTHFFDSTPSSCLPCGTALGATWNTDLIYRLGQLLSDEAHAKGAHVLLGPTVNIQRGPLGGRGFESFSEDPILSGILAGHYVRGVQKNGVSATMKHFACNDMESARMAVDVQVTERALREVYLLPFMIAVEMASPRVFMTAYNKVNGTHAPDNHHLLQDILRGEWKWDGLVVSDWFGTYSTTEAINAGQDLEMPGPTRWRGETLVHAVTSNKLKRSTLDERVRNVLKLVKHSIENTSIPPNAPETQLQSEENTRLLREAAAESVVLLKNDKGVLPLDPAKKVAVIGPNADISTYCGGGSASLRAYHTVSPLEGIKGIANDVSFTKGLYGHRSLPQIGKLLMTVDGQRQGFTLRIYNDPTPSSGPDTRKVLETRILDDSNIWFVDYEHPALEQIWYAEIEGVLTPEKTGEWDFGLCVHGTGELFIDGELVVSNVTDQRPGSSFLGCGTVEKTGSKLLNGGKSYNVVVRWGCDKTSDLKVSGVVDFGQGGMRLGGCPRLEPRQALQDAVELAKSVDQVVLCVGTSGEWESEGQDRANMALPPGSDDLISAVLQANPNTVVLIQSGTPVSMPWVDQTSTIAQAWFGGNEAGNGIADMLFGAANPSGKLPITMPRRVSDNPSALSFRSEGGRVLYSEDVHVGYRWYDTLDIEPLFPFGHGLSYTTFELSDLHVEEHVVSESKKLAVNVTVTNTGSRSGAAVVQVYAKPPHPTPLAASALDTITRSSKELKGFAKIDLGVGASGVAKIELDVLRATSYWSEREDYWYSEAGDYTVLVGMSSRWHVMRVVLGGGSACFRVMVLEQRRIALDARGCISSVALTYQQGLEVQNEEAIRTTQTPAVISPELHVESPTHYEEEETIHTEVPTPLEDSHLTLAFESSPNAPSLSRPPIHSHVAHFNPSQNVGLFEHQFQTDEICPRSLFMTIMTDYIDHIYPLVPVVHLPTFRADLATNKDVTDLDTLLLLASIASLTVGLLPSKFDSYHALAARFGTRTAMISHCSQMCIRLRPADYWDHISHRKWATAYCLSIGAFQVGQINQSRMFEAESMQLARLLGMHIVSEYEGLNPIETQLRKKSFWLQLYTFAHSKIQPGRCNYLTYLDNYTIRDVNFAALEPLNIVDENITETGIVGQLPSTPSVGLPNNTDSADDAPFHSTTVFIMASRAFLLGMRESMVNDGCNCGFGRSPEERLSKLRDLLDQLRYILDGLPTHMRQWGPGDNYQPFDGSERRQGVFTGANIDHLQNESTRANLHVSHLWLQNFLLDKMDVALQEMKDREGDDSYVTTQLKQNWRDREDVARQLLHILHSIPHAYLEPNGLYLIYKVRSIASSLLNCPFEMDRQLSRRVSEYIQEFTKVLSYLDRSEIVNTDGLRSWIDEGQHMNHDT